MDIQFKHKDGSIMAFAYPKEEDVRKIKKFVESTFSYDKNAVSAWFTFGKYAYFLDYAKPFNPGIPNWFRCALKSINYVER